MKPKRTAEVTTALRTWLARSHQGVEKIMRSERLAHDLRDENLQSTNEHRSQELQLGLPVHLQRLDDGNREQINHRIRGHARNRVAKVEGVDLDTSKMISIARLRS